MPNAAEERILGTILDEEGEIYLVEAEDGTRYKVEWYGGSSLWSVGDTAILTAASGFGYMVYGPTHFDMIIFMLRTIVFFGLFTSAFVSETLKTLVNASAGFSVAILQQLAAVQSDPTPTTLAEKTISYAKAKTAYSRLCVMPWRNWRTSPRGAEGKRINAFARRSSGDTPIRRLADSGVDKKLVQGRQQKVAINLFVRFDLCTTNPKE
jgi:hypothetical protein